MEDAPEEDRPDGTAPADGGEADRPPAERLDDQPPAERLDDQPLQADLQHTDDEPDDAAAGNVFGPRPDEPDRGPILPGDPELENVAFVLLGVGTALLLIADLVLL